MKQGEGNLIMIPTDTDVTCQWQVDEANKSVNLRSVRSVHQTHTTSD